MESNPHSGISGRNTVWEQGVDYPRLLAHVDVVWTEEGDPAQVTAAGVLVSKIRTYKMAEMLHDRVFTYTGGERGNRLQMAEAMVFNRQTQASWMCRITSPWTARGRSIRRISGTGAWTSS